jgi:alpha-L-fucosidase
MTRALFLLALLLCPLAAAAQPAFDAEGVRNSPERVAWFPDLAFGMFIHWSHDSQLGSVISHSMVGASDDYLERYVEELPGSFNPYRFNPKDWASLARLAGMKYVVFTAKHHNGFCMYDTETTDFNVMNTPFGRDVTAEIIEAFREQGIAVGLYFSPDDFHYLYRQGTLISRVRPEALPINNPGLMAHDQAQVRELLTKYGPIDMFWIDGPPEGLREVAWDTDPNVLITRGAMETPEQTIPGQPLEGPWEACFTMGNQWQYKPTNEEYKSGTQLIEMLIETRAKGGNLLLNVGPDPYGVIPPEQEARLREIALWNWVNGEAIYDVKPWGVTNQDSVWFTQKKDESAVYAFVTGSRWPHGTWKTLTLTSMRATEKTRVSVLGQNDLVLEYQPNVLPQTTWKQTPDGLEITAMRAQRIYNDRKWPNPVVLKIENVERR